MCWGGADQNRERRKREKRRRKMKQMQLQMQQQQEMARQQQLAMQQQMQAAAAAARNAANKPIPMADQPLQTASTGAKVRRNKSAGNRKAYSNRGARFSVALNMGGYGGRRGGMPNV